MNRRYLVIGASGLVGGYLFNSLIEAGENPMGTFLANTTPSAERLNICQQQEVNHFFERFRPEVVFLPAALTHVDYCEKNPAAAYEVNVMGVKNIADACGASGAYLIYFSSDYIFDGTSGPYDEQAVANPLSVYGQQKLIAEHYITLTLRQSLIVRTTVVYGWEQQGKNFVYRLVKSLQEGRAVKVPIDQVGTPTYALELAQNAMKLSNMKQMGIINIAGSDCINRYEFALEIAKIFNIPQSLIQPVKTEELNQAAKRPLLAGLKTEKAAALLQTSFSSSAQGLHSLLTEKTKARVLKL